MLFYCLKCRKSTESKNPKILTKEKNKNGRVILLSKQPLFDSKRWKFLKEQEASRSLGSLGRKT